MFRTLRWYGNGKAKQARLVPMCRKAPGDTYEYRCDETSDLYLCTISAAWHGWTVSNDWVHVEDVKDGRLHCGTQGFNGFAFLLLPFHVYQALL